MAIDPQIHDNAGQFIARPLGMSLMTTGAAGVFTALAYLFTPADFYVFWWAQTVAVFAAYWWGGTSPLQKFISMVLSFFWIFIQLLLVLMILVDAVTR